MAVAFVLLAVFIGALVHLFMTMPTSFVPNEDQGYVLAAVDHAGCREPRSHGSDREPGGCAVRAGTRRS